MLVSDIINQSLVRTMSNVSSKKILLQEIAACLSHSCSIDCDIIFKASTSSPEELAKLYDENLQLAKCLREKGINVPDPTQEEPKLDLSELDKSKDEITPILKECGYGESGYEK